MVIPSAGAVICETGGAVSIPNTLVEDEDWVLPARSRALTLQVWSPKVKSSLGVVVVDDRVLFKDSSM